MSIENQEDRNNINHRNTKKSNDLKRYILVLTFSCVFLMTLVILLLVKYGKKEIKEEFRQPEGELVLTDEVYLSITPFETDLILGGENLQFQELRNLIADFLGEEMGKELLNPYENTYSEEAYVIREDYLAVYADMLRKMEKTSELIENSFFVLASLTEIDQGKTNLILGKSSFYTNEGFIEISEEAREGKDILYHTVTGYVKDGEMYWITDIHVDEYSFQNAYLLEPKEGLFYADGIYYNYDPDLFVECDREQVIDIVIQNGAIDKVTPNTDKITGGKILSITDDGIEVDGYEMLFFDENVKVYDLCNDLSDGNISMIPIGYDFCDFVIEDKNVQAILVARTGEMDHIRVLLRGPNLEGRYYETLTFVSDADLTIIYPDKEEMVLPKKEKLTLSVSDFEIGNRIKVNSTVLTQKTKVLEVLRSQGNANYRGDFEVVVTEDGFVLINELALEEYLYAVVPSEMPSSYPKEALKAQAICARTYAYMNILKAGYPKYGAHVDDSAGYQVYQNISENVNTSQAVKDTSKQMLFYKEELAQTYYYSTSPGFGNSVEVWNGRSEGEFPYMTSLHYGTRESEYTPESLQDNAVYDEYIRKTDSSDFEAKEGWYRWTYSPETISSDLILEKLKTRYGMNSSLVLTKTGDGSFESKDITELGDVLNIEITKRLPGGNVQELVITGTQNTFKVITELYIRAILCDGETKVLRQSGDYVAMPSLLPSGFISLEIEKIDEIVVQYKVYGGGFGHGVGMSQNGAKAMANLGYSTEQILGYYYQGCTVRLAQD